MATIPDTMRRQTRLNALLRPRLCRTVPRRLALRIVQRIVVVPDGLHRKVCLGLRREFADVGSEDGIFRLTACRD